MSRSQPAIYALTVVVLLGASAAGLALGGTAGGTAPDQPAAGAVDFEVTEDGTRYTVAPDRLRQGCPGGTDCIPSIDDPSFQSAGGAGWLAADDLVIGIEVDGETRAYPLRVLNVHEIVNDEAGTRWGFDGRAREGPHAGAQLERLNSHGIFWFAWSEFHPETDVYWNRTVDGSG